MNFSEFEQNRILLGDLISKDAEFRRKLESRSSQQLHVNNLSNADLQRQQLLVVENQNEGLDNLLTAINTQKNIALGIGTEMSGQNRLIDEIADGVNNADSRIRTQTNLAGTIVKTSGNMKLNCIIILLVIAIIIVLCIPR
uniref:Syntaxin-51 (Trinotate prediction) n=1 Tax=Myxobolus squamalis TaxID=59785 RepID=A0A6B2G2C0_MYXSQ